MGNISQHFLPVALFCFTDQTKWRFSFSLLNLKRKWSVDFPNCYKLQIKNLDFHNNSHSVIHITSKYWSVQNSNWSFQVMEGLTHLFPFAHNWPQLPLVTVFELIMLLKMRYETMVGHTNTNLNEHFFKYCCINDYTRKLYEAQQSLNLSRYCKLHKLWQRYFK